MLNKQRQKSWKMKRFKFNEWQADESDKQNKRIKKHLKNSIPKSEQEKRRLEDVKKWRKKLKKK